MKKTPQKTTKPRIRMLDAAGKLFRSRGFHGTGLEEIVKRSGAPKGSLYHYFPGGKEQLGIETVQHMAGQIAAVISTVMSSEPDPIVALRALFEGTARALEASYFEDGCPVATVTLDVASDHDTIRQVCDKAFQTWLDILLEPLRKKGLSRNRAKRMATLILSALEGALALSRARRSTEPLTAVSIELTRLIESATSSGS